MKTRKNNKGRSPGIKIDKSLEKQLEIPMFQEKLAQANETLKRVGLPKDMKKFK